MLQYYLDAAFVKLAWDRLLKLGFYQKIIKTCFDCKMFDVANWVANLNWEDGFRGLPSHETFSVASQAALEI